MVGYVRNDSSNNIAAGNVINASDHDGEYDAIVAAFHATTGHTHDGTAAEGSPITVVGPAQEYVGGAADFTPKTDSVYDLGTTSVRWATGYLDTLVLTNGVSVASGGTGATTEAGARTALGLEIGTDVQAYDAFLGDIGALTDPNDDRILFWDDTAGALTWLDLGTNLTITGTTINAAAAAGGDAWGDVVDADIIPNADSTWDLGNTGTRFASAFIDTLTLTNDLAVVDGGTGASTAGDARTNLGLGSLATASTINNSNWSGTDLALANGGTGASLVDPNADRILFWDDSAGAMTFLTTGTNLTITGTTINATTSGDLWSDPVDAAIVPDTNATRDLGSTGNRFADAFITTLTLTNDLPVTDGGTGASTASAARTNLGLAIGTNVQAQDAGLQAIADATITGVSGSDADVITGTAGTSGNVATWNADGDVVDGGKKATVIIPPTTDTTSELSWEDWDTTNIHSFEIFLDLDPATIGSVLMQFWDGAAWYTSAQYYWYRKTTKFNAGITETNPRAALDTSIELSPNDADEFKYHFKFINPTLNQPAGRPYIEWSGIYNVPVIDAYHVIGAGYYDSSASFSGVKIFMAPEADSSTFSADALCIGHYR